ncbi:ERF family protein [Caproicibacterium sp. BJN0003]|uniref:ERF family protein n=1 Tax=Caproicibacterium sp. BJN0003 TaxID=2994078 RepID=UPI0022510361|nr:ERF family protein [Caproicibacterium sp. BJN0003]UZT82120.1 ERF family protein [Caproicibacterium sp. BJN0003]
MKIESQLLEVQKELKAPKGQYNSFGKYNYRSCEDILEAVKPILSKNGLSLVLSDSVILSGDWHYIMATARLKNADGEAIEVTAYARESQSKKGMDDSQITGTASSYARKYALNGLFLIDDTKDADTDGYKKAADRPADKPKEYICEECGKPIKPFKTLKGEIIGVEALVANTKARYKKALCAECSVKAKAEKLKDGT